MQLWNLVVVGEGIDKVSHRMINNDAYEAQDGASKSDLQESRKHVARKRWRIAVLLMRNPSLIAWRKKALAAKKEVDVLVIRGSSKGQPIQVAVS